jgi:hypothetical protein
VGVGRAAFAGERLAWPARSLEVVAASADGVSHPSHDHQHQADDQESLMMPSGPPLPAASL